MTGFLLLAVGVPTAEAQDVARSFEQLRALVRVGDTVTVTDVTGRERQGTIAELSSSSLGLMARGTCTDFSEMDLDTVSRRDSRWNGTLWGLVAGASLGTLLEKSLADEYGRDDIDVGSVVAPFAGIGAGVGFAVDAMIKGRRVLYARPGSVTGSATVSAAWNARQKGMVVSLVLTLANRRPETGWTPGDVTVWAATTPAVRTAARKARPGFLI